MYLFNRKVLNKVSLIINLKKHRFCIDCSSFDVASKWACVEGERRSSVDQMVTLRPVELFRNFTKQLSISTYLFYIYLIVINFGVHIMLNKITVYDNKLFLIYFCLSKTF